MDTETCKKLTNDGKCFGELVETLLLEALLREASAGDVALAIIDLTKPAFVFPTGGADVNTLVG